MVEIPEIVTRIFFEIFWVTLPMILLFALLLSLQCAVCVWSRRAKNTEFEDLEMARCNTVYTSTH